MKKLFLKQGTKSILKNRSQFIVVMILTFLFALIATSWITIKRNINSSFDNTVSNYFKPDYFFTEKVSDANASLDQTKNQFVPLYDIIDTDGDKNEFISLDDGDVVTTGNNFVLIDNSVNNFLTNTFSSDNFKTIYKDFFVPNNFNSFGYGKAVSVYEIKNDKPSLDIQKDKYKIDPSLSFNNQNSLYSEFIFDTAQLLSKNYIEDFKNNAPYLKDTVFYKFLINNPNEKFLFLKDIYSFLNSNLKDDNDFYNLNSSYLFSYFLNAIETLPILLINNLNNYFENMMDSFLVNNQSDSQVSDWGLLYESYFDGKNAPKLDMYKYNPLDFWPSTKEKNIIYQNMETSYQYLFGNNLKDDNQIFSNYQNSCTPLTSFNFSDEQKLDFLKLFNNDNGFNGLHGYTSTFKTLINDNKFTGIVFDQNNYVYSRVSLNKTYASSIGGLDYDQNDYAFDNKNLFSIRKLHFNFVASLTNVSFQIREECNSYDAINKINYRFIILNDDTKLNVISGDKKLQKDEIYMSDEFYQKNNKPKNYSLNNYNLKVNGVADDALTYFQFADIEAPIIDKDTTCLIYLKKETLKSIFENKDGNGLTSVFSNTYFLNGDKNNISNFFGMTKWFTNDMVKNDYTKINIQNFQDSNWNLSWKFMSKINTFLNFIGVFTIVICAFLIIYVLFVVVGSCVKDNLSQIKNLKIIGVPNKNISTMFMGYSFFIILFSLTFGYICGSLLQYFYVKWFTSYMVIYKKGINFDWLVFLIVFASFSIFIILANYFLTWIKVKNISKDKRMVKILVPKKTPFVLKLNFIVFWKSKIEIIILFCLTFFASTVLGTFTLTMSSIKKYINDSENTINYSNSYTMEEPVYNSPFSRKSLTAWDGFSVSNTLGSDLSNDIQTYYDDTDKYQSSVNGSSILPNLIYSDNKIKWLDDYIASNDNFINDMLPLFIQNATNISNKGFSIGSFEEFQNFILHTNNSKYTETDGSEISSARKKDLDKFVDFINKEIPFLIKLVFGSFFKIDNSSDWRDILLSLARNLLPNTFSKKYTTNERKTQFYFSINSENYIPGKEDLATVEKVKVNNSFVQLTGLSNRQTSYNFKVSNSNLSPFLSAENIDQISNLGTNDIYLKNGIKIYDKESKTLYIPAVLSDSYTKKLSKYSELNIDTNSLAIKNVGVLPKNSWTYAAFDESNYDKDLWKNVYQLNSSKFNYKNEFNDDGNLSDNAQLFVNFKKNKGVVSESIRPYYNYNKIMIMIPKSYFNSKENFIDSITPKNYTIAQDRYLNISKNDDLKDIYKNWYGEISSNLVSNDVKKAWGNSNGDYYWVAPYNLNYNINFKQTQSGVPGVFDVINGGLNNWFDDALNRNSSPIYFTYSPQILENVDHIILEKVGIIDSYDQNIAIVDQALINEIFGFGTDYQITKPISSNSKALFSYKSGDQNIPIYNKKSVSEVESEQFSMKELYQNDYIQQSWFNTKLSSIDEPLNLTTGLAGSLNKNLGVGLLLHDGISNVKSGYKTVELESLKIKTIISIFAICISIGMLLFIVIIVISSQIFFIISNIYLNGQKNMMKILKINGYSSFSRSIIVLTPEILSFVVSIFLSTLLPLFIVPLILNQLEEFNTYINIWFNFAIQLGVIFIIFISFIFGLLIANRKFNKTKIYMQKFD